MIKFEEHDGLIFKMLDKPVPLKEKDTNVLVRFITHGVIGEYVMEHWLDCNQKNVPIYIDDVDSDGDVTVWIDENRNSHHCCPFPMFEIIGTLVEEGSAEWAIYQMMQGYKVTKEHLEHIYWHYDSRPHLQCISEYNCGTLQIMVTPEIWVKTADKDGWQLCEPKEEPQPDKEPIANCENCKHVCTKSNIDHCHMYEPKVEPPKEPDYVICKRCGGTGYEIKEPCDAPNPESATQTSLSVSDATQLKVGDWVEIESSHTKGKTFVSVIKEIPNQDKLIDLYPMASGKYKDMQKQEEE